MGKECATHVFGLRRFMVATMWYGDVVVVWLCSCGRQLEIVCEDTSLGAMVVRG